MSIDPRHLRPGQLAALLNSTALGEVTSDSRVRRNVVRAGLRVGDGKQVNLLGYSAWLLTTWCILTNSPEATALTGYEAMKEQARARNAALSLSGRNIGDIPEVVAPGRKNKASTGFCYFCETYFPEIFYLAWSNDHLKVMTKIEEAVLHGGLFAMAMPRGAGKTSIAECACLWAVLYGHRDFVALIGSDEGHALDMLQSIKTELDGNELLLQDFPEAVYPIQRLEGIAHRATGQLCNGLRTHIGWTAQEIILPTIPASKASGAIIQVAGITGRIRGMKFKQPDGKTVRPSLVVIDDPQTDESARSPSQCANRESILAGAVLGLAGPGEKISGIMPCTVIRPDDMADRILDREKHPQWQGERTKMVYSFPTNEKLWAQYAQILSDGLRNDQGIAMATAFYRAKQEAMDEGARIAWVQRFNYDEASAIQHAMNLKLQDEAAFWAEYQNEPKAEELKKLDLSAADVAKKTNGFEKGMIPPDTTILTMFADIQENMLFYVVIAWTEQFTGYIVEYGTVPDQKTRWFTLRETKAILKGLAPGAGLEGSITAGLKWLETNVISRGWPGTEGKAYRIDRCIVDANWGQSTDIVYAFCHRSLCGAILLPSHRT